MTQRHDMEPLLQDWLHHTLDAIPDPIHRYPQISAEAIQTPQQPQWPTRLPQWRFQTMLSASKFVVAGAIVALFGGLLYTAVLTQPSDDRVPAVGASASTQSDPAELASVDPSATAEPAPVATAEDAAIPEAPTITLPDVLPDGVRSGTVQTPAGPARWVHLTGRSPASRDEVSEGEVIPAPQALVPWKDGIAAMGYFGLWTTSDGVDWTVVPLPGDPAGPFQRRVLKRVGGTYVLIYTAFGPARRDPIRVWTAEDLDGAWREIEASALQAAAPGAGWNDVKARIAAGPVALADGRIVFSVTHEYRLPRTTLGLLPLQQTKRMKRLAAGRYALCPTPRPRYRGSCSDGGENAKWIVRFEEADEGLSVVNDRNDKRLGRLDGADLSELYEGGTGLKVDSFAIDGDTIVPIDAPWPALGLLDSHSSEWRPQTVVFAPGSSTPVFASWDSRSELRPGDPGVPVVARGLPPSQARKTTLTVSEHADRISAILQTDAGSSTGRTLGAWESTDGVTWREAPPGLPDGARLSHTGSAWYAEGTGVDETGFHGFKHWMLLGGAWVSLDELGFPSDMPPEETGLGNVTVFTSDPLREVLDIWVLTHPVSD